MPEPPIFNFEFDASVQNFAVSKDAYLSARPNSTFGYIATSIVVLDEKDPSNPRVLLLQRAASDSLPNKWEPPGGACDDEDESILHAAARELWEEAGLQAAHISGPVCEPHFFTIRKGKVCQFSFVAQVNTARGTSPTVELDPKEHQSYVWATEDEVKAKKVDGIDLDFTRPEVERTVLKAFEYFKKKHTNSTMQN